MAGNDSTKDIEDAGKIGDVADNEEMFELQRSMDSNDIEKNTYSVFQSTSTKNTELDEMIFKALKKIKEYFFNNKMEEQKLSEFMFEILTLNINKITTGKNMLTNTEVLDHLVDQMIESHQNKNEPIKYDIIESMFGQDTAKAIFQKLGTEKVDVIVEKLLGKDTKEMICDKLERQNLDDLLNNLIDEKLKLDNDSEAKHPNFDQFIEKILGKDTEEFIKKKLEDLNDISVDLEEEARVVDNNVE